MKNELDEHLKQLSKEAQQFSPYSRERQIALNKLLSLIIKSGKIISPYSGQLKGLHEDVYAEALQNLFIYICTRIEDYNPDRGEVLTWVNFLFKNRFLREAYMSTTTANKTRKKIETISINSLDCELVDTKYQSNNSLFDEVVEYVKNDPENIFRKTYLANHPDVNFQVLAIKKIDGASWKELAEEYKIQIATLSSFYQRCLKKFAPKFKEYCSVD